MGQRARHRSSSRRTTTGRLLYERFGSTARLACLPLRAFLASATSPESGFAPAGGLLEHKLDVAAWVD